MLVRGYTILHQCSLFLSDPIPSRPIVCHTGPFPDR